MAMCPNVPIVVQIICKVYFSKLELGSTEKLMGVYSDFREVAFI
jgi:hypothetical protein